MRDLGEMGVRMGMVPITTTTDKFIRGSGKITKNMV